MEGSCGRKWRKNGDFWVRAKFGAEGFWAHFGGSATKMACEGRCLRLFRGLVVFFVGFVHVLGACVRFGGVWVVCDDKRVRDILERLKNHGFGALRPGGRWCPGISGF